MADATQVVYNHDIVGIQTRLNRFITEMYNSVSNGTSQTNTFDQVRLSSYLDAIDGYHAWVLGQPHLDLPETSPRAYALEANPVIADIENEDLADVIRMLQISRDEIVNSQSARDAAGLNKFDSARLSSIVAKVRAFLTSYMTKVSPLDLPESSPQDPLSGPGKLGV